MKKLFAWIHNLLNGSKRNIALALAGLDMLLKSQPTMVEVVPHWVFVWVPIVCGVLGFYSWFQQAQQKVTIKPETNDDNIQRSEN
jgi:hypothetical protein